MLNHFSVTGWAVAPLLEEVRVPLGQADDRREVYFGTAVFRRGEGYLRHGHVVSLEVVRDTADLLEIAGVVKGSRERPYSLRVDWDGETFEGNCSCPYGYFCKHAVALLLAHQ